MSDNLINKGKHRAQCQSIAFDQTGTDDKVTAVVSFRIVDANDPQDGWHISAFLYFTENAVDRTLESLRHLGWVGENLDELPQLAAAGQLGEVVEIVVDHEEWDGKLRAKVKWVNKIGGAVLLKKPLEGQALSQFSQRMRSRVRTVPAGKPTGNAKPAAPKHPNAPGGGDDEIPF